MTRHPYDDTTTPGLLREAATHIGGMAEGITDAHTLDGEWPEDETDAREVVGHLTDLAKALADRATRIEQHDCARSAGAPQS